MSAPDRSVLGARLPDFSVTPPVTRLSPRKTGQEGMGTRIRLGIRTCQPVSGREIYATIVRDAGSGYGHPPPTNTFWAANPLASIGGSFTPGGDSQPLAQRTDEIRVAYLCGQWSGSRTTMTNRCQSEGDRARAPYGLRGSALLNN